MNTMILWYLKKTMVPPSFKIAAMVEATKQEKIELDSIAIGPELFYYCIKQLLRSAEGSGADCLAISAINSLKISPVSRKSDFQYVAGNIDAK